ncbi:polysaccharide biosynthesis tyrosine autokinase [Microbacterium sp. E-13]|uniref:polysaccharide biosynthesis tyrosine autokinase n=1 Tax=Microbacterium sp. E-13 TaxID=3404048 RepID=UPI003CEA8445
MNLRDFVRMLRVHWLAISLATLVGVFGAIAWSAVLPPVYTANASGYVSASFSDGTAGAALAGDQLALSKVKSYLDVGSWRSVAESAIEELALDVTPEYLVQQVDVSNPTDTVIIHVAANGPSPKAARDLAESWIRGMVREIDALESDSTEDGAATLIPGDSARLPLSQSSPNLRLNIAIGALVGFAAGLAYSLIRRVFDRRVRTVKEIEQATGIAVVGTLPLDKELVADRTVFRYDGAGQLAGSRAHAEAMRELRTNLHYVDVDHPPRVIVVTSPIPGDGKSTTAANLAMSLAAAGRRVALIDADLRRPVQDRIFGFPNDVGLSDVLAGRVGIADVAHRVEGAESLVIIGAGRTPPNPSEMLGSQKMRSLLDMLRREDSVVVVDSPPTIPVADAAILSGSADGVLLVVSAGKTTYELMQRALDNIARAKGHVLGVVLNKVPRRGIDAANYGYRYAGYYDGDGSPGREPEAQTAGRSGSSRTRARRRTPKASPTSRRGRPLEDTPASERNAAG